jgi:hypothetical protein
MTDKKTSGTQTLTSADIVVAPAQSRRSFLARAGLVLGAAAAVGVTAREAQAGSDRERQTDNDPNPPNGDHREQTDSD